jgi:hypothetical protein
MHRKLMLTSVLIASLAALASTPAGAIQQRVVKCRCYPPYLYRGADPQDWVCVTAESHGLILQENGQANQNRISGTDNHCKSGFVWRDAFDGDGVCVTPAARDRVHNENAHWGAYVVPGESVDAPGTSVVEILRHEDQCSARR